MFVQNYMKLINGKIEITEEIIKERKENNYKLNNYQFEGIMISEKISEAVFLHKKHAGHTCAYDITQIKPKVRQRVGLLPLGRGGIVSVQRVIGRGLDGLEQTCQEEDDSRPYGQRQDRCQQIEADGQTVKKYDNRFAAEFVSQLAA